MAKECHGEQLQDWSILIVQVENEGSIGDSRLRKLSTALFRTLEVGQGEGKLILQQSS